MIDHKSKYLKYKLKYEKLLAGGVCKICEIAPGLNKQTCPIGKTNIDSNEWSPVVRNNKKYIHLQYVINAYLDGKLKKEIINKNNSWFIELEKTKRYKEILIKRQEMAQILSSNNTETTQIDKQISPSQPWFNETLREKTKLEKSSVILTEPKSPIMLDELIADKIDLSNESYCDTIMTELSTNSTSCGKKITQISLIMEYILSNPNRVLSKREIEKNYTLTWCMKDLTDEQIKCVSSKEELIKICGNVPGDVQRQLRTAVKTLRKKGFFINKHNESKNEYLYEPEKNTNIEAIVDHRDIFYDADEKEAFIKSHNSMCELCGSIHSFDNPFNIDHWRPHAVYNTSAKENAVLLCQNCNQLHHDHDGIVLIRKLDSICGAERIMNWIRIETRIRQFGLHANDNHIKDQEIVINKLYKDLNERDINIFNLYKGLDKLFYIDEQNNLKYIK